MSILLGLVLMPVLFRHLSKEELGVWLLLGQSCAVLGVFDLGFGAVLTRRIAFAVGKNSQDLGDELPVEAVEEIADLVATGRRMYCWLALSAFVVSFSAGWFYLKGLDLRGISMGTVWVAWGVLCLSQALSIWAAVWTCLLQGVGYVGWDSVLGTLVNSLTLLVQMVLVLFRSGLEGLAFTAAAGALTQRWLILRFARRRRAELFRSAGRWRTEMFRGMLRPALRAWLTSLGCLLVANTDQFFIAAHKGASAIPAYRAAFLLVINLHLLAGVFCAPSQVFVSRLWQAGQLQQIRAILRRNARLGLLAMSCGGGAILALGPTLFDFWLGPGNFVGYPVLGIFLGMFALEHHANVFGSCGRATDDEAYAASSIAAGVLKLGLASLLSLRLGLTGLALSTLVAQGLTNDWFMVYRSAKRLRIEFATHFREVLVPCLLIFLAALILGKAAGQLFSEQRLLVRVGTVSLVAGLLLGASVWRLGLDASQRTRVLQWASFA